MTEPSGLRERKRAKTRARLAAAALDCFERKGFEESTVAEIAEAADLSPRTLFRYFASKEDLVFAPAGDYQSVLRTALRERPISEPPLEALKQALLAFADHLERHKREVVRGRRVIASSPTLQKREAEESKAWTQALAREVAAREGAPEATERHLNLTLLAIAPTAAAMAGWAKESLPLPVLLERAFAFSQREMTAAGPPG
jgi:AcrR family transcriptional regulator